MEKTKNKINRRTRRILLAMGCALIMAGTLLYGNIWLISQQKEMERQQITAMVGLLREQFPELSDAELMKLLKDPADRQERLERGADLMQKYGYDDAFFSAREKRLMWQLVLFNSGVIFLTGVICVMLYAQHRLRVRKEVKELQRYFDELNHGSYDLDPGQTTEGDLSMLQSDIFKVTQLLRTAAEHEKEKNEALSRWLADISHQLKTPIASIRINLDNVLDDPDMPVELRKEFMKECSMQLEWISSLVQTLLKLARIDAGTVELKKEEMDILSVAREAQKKLEILAEIQGVEVVWEDEPKGEVIDPETLGPVPMTGDPAWQLEAISNILKNCIEHSGAGSRVYLSMRNTTVFKELTIRDTGDGIPEEDLPHIFERFYRAKNARKESVGIGLSLASSIVENGGGKIMVSSVRGEGTSFVIRYLL
ncbi:MAG: HAMP domain-containing histidine kinase [Eubacterium sp.]|nr:HAMP domain-containing histidine kinase [Eubacterium sp.]